jgi:hypothetical protein
VFKKAIFIYGCIITLRKVASKWAQGNVPVLKIMLLEVSGRGEDLLAFQMGALQHARGAGLMSQNVRLKFEAAAFDDLAAKMALKLPSIEFSDILLYDEIFMFS